MVSQSVLMHVVAVVLMLVAVIVHITCIGTTHIAGMDFSEIEDKLMRQMDHMKGMNSYHANIMRNTIAQLLRTKLHYGPWKYCSEIQGKTKCLDFEDPIFPDWIKAVQAFAVMAVLAAAGAIILGVISRFLLGKGNWKSLLTILSCVLACLAGGFIFVEIIIIAAKFNSDETFETFGMKPPSVFEGSAYLGWGFGVDILAAIVLVIAGLVIFFGGRAAQREGVV